MVYLIKIRKSDLSEKEDFCQAVSTFVIGGILSTLGIILDQ
jgi:hypothetical protein